MNPFRRDAFDALTGDQKQQRARELAAYLSERLAAAADFDHEIDRIIASLREQGHDIWSWDYDDGRQLWGPNDQNPQMAGLVIEFDAPSSVVAEWIERGSPHEV